jgi:type I site-specific restriction endonuclease
MKLATLNHRGSATKPSMFPEFRDTTMGCITTPSRNPRVAVTVDMIATGTDVKPLEVLIFMRDVKSELYFEQMKGRGARTISAEKLREVTPDAEAKTRFVLIDAVGVSESLKTVSQPLDRDRAVSFERLIDDIAAGRRDDDAFATLAARLAALDRRIGEKDRAAIVKASGGVDLSGLAARLLDAVDPDALAKHAPKDAPEPDQKKAREAAKDDAATIFDDPTLRRLLKDVKAAADIRIDTISTDAVVSSGWDEKKATDTVERFKRFLEERRDDVFRAIIQYAVCRQREIASLALFGRRPQERVDSVVIPASKNLHTSRPRLVKGADINSWAVRQEISTSLPIFRHAGDRGAPCSSSRSSSAGSSESCRRSRRAG